MVRSLLCNLTLKQFLVYLSSFLFLLALSFLNTSSSSLVLIPSVFRRALLKIEKICWFSAYFLLGRHLKHGSASLRWQEDRNISKKQLTSKQLLRRGIFPSSKYYLVRSYKISLISEYCKNISGLRTSASHAWLLSCCQLSSDRTFQHQGKMTQPQRG